MHLAIDDHCQTAADVRAAARNVSAFRHQLSMRPILEARAAAAARRAEELARANAEAAELAHREAEQAAIANENAVKEKAFVQAKPYQDITVTRALRMASAEIGMPMSELVSPTKISQRHVEYRQIVAWCCQQLTGRSTIKIGEAMHRDHSTIHHGVHKVADDIAVGGELGARAVKLRDAIKARHDEMIKREGGQ